MRDHVDTQLVRDALAMALGRRQPEAGLIHHSARGSQYARHADREIWADHGIACSMSGKGACLDKAVAERFFGSLKRERTSQRYYLTRQEARDDSIAYIEMVYNSWRKHSYLGYVSPNAYEKIAQAASLCVRFYLTTTDAPVAPRLQAPIEMVQDDVGQQGGHPLGSAHVWREDKRTRQSYTDPELTPL
jgi:hypothetical protein